MAHSVAGAGHVAGVDVVECHKGEGRGEVLHIGDGGLFEIRRHACQEIYPPYEDGSVGGSSGEEGEIESVGVRYEVESDLSPRETGPQQSEAHRETEQHPRTEDRGDCCL